MAQIKATENSQTIIDNKAQANQTEANKKNADFFPYL